MINVVNDPGYGLFVSKIRGDHLDQMHWIHLHSTNEVFEIKMSTGQAP